MEKKKETKKNTKKEEKVEVKKNTKAKKEETVAKAEVKKKETKTVEISVDKIKNAVIVILLIVIVLGVSFMASGNTKEYSEQNESTNTSESSETDTTTALQKESESISEDEQADIKEVDVDEYLDKKEEDEASVIYIARPTCHYCQLETPIMKHIVYQYPDANIYYLNTDEFSEDDQTKFTESDDMFNSSFGTPTTIVVKGGKIVDSIQGATPGDNLLEMFRKNGIIS